MELVKQLALDSPNVWGSARILEAWVAPSRNPRRTAQHLPEIAQRLAELAQPYCSAAEFSRLVRPGASADLVLAIWLKHLTRKIQGLAGADMPAGRVLEAADGSVCRVAIVFEDEGLARPSLELAYGLLLSAIDGADFELAEKLRELQALANELCLGPSTRAIVLAARARGIPVRRLNEEASFVQFGQGARQRRICTAETDGTGAIAESIAQDKELTKSLLSRAGVPVPHGRAAESAADAWQAANEVGLPVVVKPRDANHGRGVAIKLSSQERIMSAYEAAAAEGTGVLVEQFVVGVMHRVLVVDNQAVAVSRGQPEEVVGDGVHTVAQLVDQVNEDPRRGDEYALPFCRLKIDRIARLILEHQGFEPESVPPPGVTVVIRRNGEYTTDVTDNLHPEVAARAVMAARVVGLDVAGIDLVATDISRPLEEQGGMVIEVNAGPGLQMHSEPQIGRARPVGAAIVETLFPDGHTGRIPVVTLTSGAGSTTAAQVAAHLVRASGQTVGLACAAGTFVSDRRLPTPLIGSGPGASELMLNPLVQFGVFEITPTAFFDAGLPMDSSRVTIVAPAGRESAPPAHPSTDVQLAAAMHESDAWRGAVVETVSPLGVLVLAADDGDAPRLAALSRGAVLYCNPSESHPMIQEHRAGGGKAVFLRGGVAWAACGEQEFELGALPRSAPPDTLAVLLGIAAAWSAGVTSDVLVRGLATLPPDFSATDSGSQSGNGAPHVTQPRVA